MGYSWQWWVVVFQFITLVGERRLQEPHVSRTDKDHPASRLWWRLAFASTKATFLSILLQQDVSHVHACTLSRYVCVPARATSRSVIGTEVQLLRSGVFHAASWGHHEVGRVAIVAFLAISTVLLFVSCSWSQLCTMMDTTPLMSIGAIDRQAKMHIG